MWVCPLPQGWNRYQQNSGETAVTIRGKDHFHCAYKTVHAAIHKENQWWKQISWLWWHTKSTRVFTSAGDVQTKPEIVLFSQVKVSPLWRNLCGSLFHSLPSSQLLLAIPYSTRAHSCCVTGLHQRQHREKPGRRSISCIFASVTLRWKQTRAVLQQVTSWKHQVKPLQITYVHSVCRVEVLCQS